MIHGHTIALYIQYNVRWCVHVVFSGVLKIPNCLIDTIKPNVEKKKIIKVLIHTSFFKKRENEFIFCKYYVNRKLLK